MPKISLSGPAELLTIIPFHLGFQPERSVVVVCFHGKRLGLVARLDLVDETLAAEAAAQTVPTLLQGSPSSVALVGFEQVRDESLALLEALATGVEDHRVVVRERLAVLEGRWRSVGCDCCPSEGWLLPEQADVPAVASYVALGHSVLADRQGLARLVEPLAPTEPRHDLAAAAIDDWQRRYVAAGGSLSRTPARASRSDRKPARGRRRRPTGRGRRPGAALGVLDGGDPTARQFLVHDSLVAWGGVLHGEIEGYGVEHWLPSLVGPLRDPRFHDALLAWLCPGMASADFLSDDLAALLGVLLGPDLRLAPAAGDHETAGVPTPDGAEPGRSPRSRADPGDPDTAEGSGTPVQERLEEGDSDALRALLQLLAAGPPSSDRHDDDTEDEDPGDDNNDSDEDDHEDDYEDDGEPPRDVFEARRVLDELNAMGTVAALEASVDRDGPRSLDLRAGLAAAPDAAPESWLGDGTDPSGWEEWDEAATPRLVLSRLEQVCRLTPADHAVPVLSLFASMAWWCGDGARAGVAVDRALELEPEDGLGRLLRHALDVGLRPRECA